MIGTIKEIEEKNCIKTLFYDENNILIATEINGVITIMRELTDEEKEMIEEMI